MIIALSTVCCTLAVHFTLILQCLFGQRQRDMKFLYQKNVNVYRCSWDWYWWYLNTQNIWLILLSFISITITVLFLRHKIISLSCLDLYTWYLNIWLNGKFKKAGWFQNKMNMPFFFGFTAFTQPPCSGTHIKHSGISQTSLTLM